MSSQTTVQELVTQIVESSKLINEKREKSIQWKLQHLDDLEQQCAECYKTLNLKDLWINHLQVQFVESQKRVQALEAQIADLNNKRALASIPEERPSNVSQ